MASYDFERFPALVVEDNAYMLLLVCSVLRALGFGIIVNAEEGGEAIDLLKLVAENPE